MKMISFHFLWCSWEENHKTVNATSLAVAAVVAKPLIVGGHLDVPGGGGGGGGLLCDECTSSPCLIPEICIAGTRGADTLFM